MSLNNMIQVPNYRKVCFLFHYDLVQLQVKQFSIDKRSFI